MKSQREKPFFNFGRNKKMNNITLTIGDFILQLQSKHDLFIEPGYEPFVSENQSSKPNVTIECFESAEFIAPAKKEMIFEAADENLRYYSIFRIGNDFIFEVFDQQENAFIQQIALVNSDFTHWKIYSEKNLDNELVPLLYPLGPIIMQYMTINSDAIMIHASCVFDGKKGRIFAGFSGAGKSTMAKIWAEEGYQIINDDRLLIRRQGDVFFVYNTPMYYADSPKRVPLNSIFLIHQSPVNDIKKISGALAVSKTLAFCIQNNFDSTIIMNNLKFMSDICAKTPVYALGVVPNKKIIDFIFENE